MKNYLKTAAVALLIIAASCSKDDSSDASKEVAEQAELQEKTVLDAAVVSDNVEIYGATKELGAPPTPNEAISMSVNDTNKSAILGEGFEISLNSTSDVVGAYIQFKSNDGEVADGYYDVNIEGNRISQYSNKKQVQNKQTKKNLNKTAKVEDDTTIAIDFNSSIEPGTFCYVICVYDADGNISAPSEECVTVESWGGNSEVVANWSLIKSVDTYSGETSEELIGEKDCYETTAYCESSSEYLEYDVCETLDYVKLNLKADGTFSIESKGIDEDLDEDAFDENCELKIEAYDYSSTGEGNWAYNSETKRLTLVEYKYTETYLGETEIDQYPVGDGELIFDGPISVNGNTLVITEDYGQGETYVSYLEK